MEQVADLLLGQSLLYQQAEQHRVPKLPAQVNRYNKYGTEGIGNRYLPTTLYWVTELVGRYRYCRQISVRSAPYPVFTYITVPLIYIFFNFQLLKEGSGTHFAFKLHSSFQNLRANPYPLFTSQL